MARKLAILSRLIPSLLSNLPFGYQSVTIQSLVPKPLQENVHKMDGNTFLKRLEEFDHLYNNLRADAAQEGCVLRYVGTIDVESGNIKASLERCVFF